MTTPDEVSRHLRRLGPEIIKAGGKQPPNVPPAPKAADAPPPAPDLPPGCRPGTVTVNLNSEMPCTIKIEDREYPGTLRLDFASGEWRWRPTPKENQ